MSFYQEAHLVIRGMLSRHESDVYWVAVGGSTGELVKFKITPYRGIPECHSPEEIEHFQDATETDPDSLIRYARSIWERRDSGRRRHYFARLARRDGPVEKEIRHWSTKPQIKPAPESFRTWVPPDSVTVLGYLLDSREGREDIIGAIVVCSRLTAIEIVRSIPHLRALASSVAQQHRRWLPAWVKSPPLATAKGQALWNVMLQMNMTPAIPFTRSRTHNLSMLSDKSADLNPSHPAWMKFLDAVDRVAELFSLEGDSKMERRAEAWRFLKYMFATAEIQLGKKALPKCVPGLMEPSQLFRRAWARLDITTDPLPIGLLANVLGCKEIGAPQVAETGCVPRAILAPYDLPMRFYAALADLLDHLRSEYRLNEDGLCWRVQSVAMGDAIAPWISGRRRGDASGVNQRAAKHARLRWQPEGQSEGKPEGKREFYRYDLDILALTKPTGRDLWEFAVYARRGSAVIRDRLKKDAGTPEKMGAMFRVLGTVSPEYPGYERATLSDLNALNKDIERAWGDQDIVYCTETIGANGMCGLRLSWVASRLVL